jgi:hypothetical protein
LGKTRLDVQQVEDFAVPAALDDVVEECARGVGGVGGVDLAACEAIDEPAVDGAEGEFAFLRTGASAGDVVEEPGELGAGEIRVEKEAGFCRHHLFAAFVLQAGAEGGGAAVLPDDGRVDGFAGLAIPQHGGFALVGDADGGDVAGGCACECVANDLDRRLPDLLGVVFDPAVLGIELAVFGLRGFERRALGVEQDGAAGGRSLIDGEDFALRHVISRWRFPAEVSHDSASVATQALD